MAPVVLIISLAVLLSAVAAAFWWQESREMPDPVVTYSLRDAAAFVHDRLSAEARSRLTRVDVDRILQWEVRYFQEVVDGRREDPIPVLGSYEAAVFVQEQAIDAGFPYDGPLITEVLDLETGYLASIGALAGEVGRGELAASGGDSGRRLEEPLP